MRTFLALPAFRRSGLMRKVFLIPGGTCGLLYPRNAAFVVLQPDARTKAYFPTDLYESYPGKLLR